MPTAFRGKQFCDVAHDLVPDLFQVFTALPSAAGSGKRAKRLADARRHVRPFALAEPWQNINETIQSDRQEACAGQSSNKRSAGPWGPQNGGSAGALREDPNTPFCFNTAAAARIASVEPVPRKTG